MRELPGIALFALGCGLLVAGVMKRRARMWSSEPGGTLRPEFAAMGEIVHPMVLFAVGLVALKTVVFYLLFDGARYLPATTFGGFLFVLAAFSVWLVLATTRPSALAARKATHHAAGAQASGATRASAAGE